MTQENQIIKRKHSLWHVIFNVPIDEYLVLFLWTCGDAVHHRGSKIVYIMIKKQNKGGTWITEVLSRHRLLMTYRPAVYGTIKPSITFMISPLRVLILNTYAYHFMIALWVLILSMCHWGKQDSIQENISPYINCQHIFFNIKLHVFILWSWKICYKLNYSLILFSLNSRKHTIGCEDVNII